MADPSVRIAISHALQQMQLPALGKPASEATDEKQRARSEDEKKRGDKETRREGDKATGAESPPVGPVLTQPAEMVPAAAGSTADGSGKPAPQLDATEPNQSNVAGGEAVGSRDAAVDDHGAQREPSSRAAGGEPQAEPEEEVTLPPLTRQMMGLRARLRTVLKSYYRRPLNTRDNTPWEVMHAMLAYELHSRVLVGGPRGKPITSIGWLCYNKPCKGQQMLRLTPDGELRATYGVGLEGHGGQFLSMLAQCGVSPDYPILVDNHKFTVGDLVAAEQKTCYAGNELSFKLIGLAHYVDLDATWTNDKGQPWDFPRVVREELAQPINGVACGGTHRLIGLTMAVQARRRQGEPLDGPYARAAARVEKYQQYAFRLQNRDGSLSTAWFRGPGNDRDIDRNVRTTGHQLEWLAYSLSDQQLRDGPAVRAVTYLTNLLYSNYSNEWDNGALSHAIHALALYDERVFEPYDQQQGVTSFPGDKTAARTRTRSNSAR